MSYYRDLGIKRNAGLKEINTGYKLQININEQFGEDNARIDRAYYVLSFPNRRLVYDNYLIDSLEPRVMRGAYFVGSALFAFLATGLYPLVTGITAFTLAFLGFVSHGKTLKLKRDMETTLFPDGNMNVKVKTIF